MFLTLVKKELLGHLHSFRFIIITLVSLMLVFVSMLIMHKNYQSRIARYQDLQPTMSQTFAIIKPSQMSILVSGMDNAICQQHIVLDRLLLSQDDTESANVLFKIFSTPDLFYLIKVIFSLCAILLSFNLVSGEKESRTLALSLSNSVGRTTYLLGKWFGGLIVLLVPLIFAVASVALFFQMSPAFQTDTQVWLKLGMFLLSSVMYLSFFFTMGLLVSCIYTRSASAIVVSLFLWTLFVFVVPGVGAMAAGRVVKMQSGDSFFLRWSVAHSEVGAKVMLGEDVGDGIEAYAGPRELAARYQARLNEQLRIAKAFTSISPAGVYTLLATDFAGTGALERVTFKDALVNYQSMIIQSDSTPLFSYQRLSVAQILSRSGIINLLVILLQNVVIFAGAYVLFLRYDVR